MPAFAGAKGLAITVSVHDGYQKTGSGSFAGNRVNPVFVQDGAEGADRFLVGMALPRANAVLLIINHMELDSALWMCANGIPQGGRTGHRQWKGRFLNSMEAAQLLKDFQKRMRHRPREAG